MEFKRTFFNVDDFYKSIGDVKTRIKTVKKYKDINIDSKILCEMLEEKWSIKELNNNILVYGSLCYYKNIKDEKSLALKKCAEEFNTEVESGLAFIDFKILEYGIKIKDQIALINDKNELDKFLESIQKDDYKYGDNEVEGAVLEACDGFMVKIKTSYYNTWKRLRSIMEYAIKNNNYVSSSEDDLSRKFLSFLRDKYEDKKVDINGLNLIQEREEFLKDNKNN